MSRDQTVKSLFALNFERVELDQSESICRILTNVKIRVIAILFFYMYNLTDNQNELTQSDSSVAN